MTKKNFHSISVQPIHSFFLNSFKRFRPFSLGKEDGVKRDEAREAFAGWGVPTPVPAPLITHITITHITFHPPHTPSTIALPHIRYMYLVHISLSLVVVDISVVSKCNCDKAASPAWMKSAATFVCLGERMSELVSCECNGFGNYTKYEI